MNLIKQKTVLYIGGFELPDKNAAAQRVIANAKILKSLGYNVVFISVDKTMKTEEPILKTISYFEGFTYYRIKYPISIPEWLNYLVSINNIADLKFNNPSIIIAYNYPAIALMRLRKYCNKKNICLFADCTEWYEAKGNIVFKAIKSLDIHIRMRILHPKLDGLIVISEYLSNFYRTKIENLVLLPPLVDLTMSKWKIIDNLTEDNISLVYAGSPGGGQKDRIDQIIRILAQIKETSTIQFIFNVVGLTKTEYLELFKNEIHPQNIDEFVLFKGRLSHIDTLKEIYNADYQIFIRDKNLTNVAGFPTKYVESISCGTPVLTNSSSNIEDYFIPGKTGFILDTSSDKLLKYDITKAISLDKESIIEMKSYCKASGMFDYNNYTIPFDVFINKALEKSN
jgi:glycosyltransferase involved in cell wall biosynthesis